MPTKSLINIRENYLVDPLEERPAALGRDVVALEGVMVALRRLHVREDVSGRLQENNTMRDQWRSAQDILIALS